MGSYWIHSLINQDGLVTLQVGFSVICSTLYHADQVDDVVHLER